MTGDEMLALAKRLFPINRSLTGDGVRQTLTVIKEFLPDLRTYEVPTGTQAFDWTIPREWRVRKAYIETPDGERICDFEKSNLHLVGYSTPIDARIPLAELQKHLYSLEDTPDAVPYVTSYYKERWGFCITHNERMALRDGVYHVVIDSELFDGSLTYGEWTLPGETADEVLLSTYVCHPSLADNELSGPVVACALGGWLASLPRRKYTYRIVIGPETIGSLTYLSRNLPALKAHVKAGFVLTCIGDDRAYSFLPSRNGDTPSDRAARHALHWHCPDFISYAWADRGSDERQYCSPGVDLPMASIMRSKYGAYPEYHTSKDDFALVTASGLAGGFEAVRLSLLTLEENFYPRATCLGEPQLGKRGLYPTLSQARSADSVHDMMEILTWADGRHSLLDIAERCSRPIWELAPIAETLLRHGLITRE